MGGAMSSRALTPHPLRAGLAGDPEPAGAARGA
jgi:hypothetical protein